MRYFLLMALFLAGIQAPVFALSKNTVCPTNSTDCLVISGTQSSNTKVAQLLISTGGADTVTVKCGSTVIIGPLYLGANAGLIHEMRLPTGGAINMICPTGHDVSLTKGSAGTPVTVWTVYEQ